KPRYESLPGDLKAVIDANSGLKPATDAGAVWDNEAVVVTELVRKRKNTIESLPEESVKSWRKAVEPIYEAWIKQISDRGQNGQKLVETAREFVSKYETAWPTCPNGSRIVRLRVEVSWIARHTRPLSSAEA